jgi:hypothetical protein
LKQQQTPLIQTQMKEQMGMQNTPIQELVNMVKAMNLCRTDENKGSTEDKLNENKTKSEMRNIKKPTNKCDI